MHPQGIPRPQQCCSHQYRTLGDMHECDQIPFQHRRKTSSTIAHFKLPGSEGTCSAVQACDMGVHSQGQWPHSQKGPGDIATSSAGLLCPHTHLCYLCAINKEQQKTPKGAACSFKLILNTGSRDYSPFKY